MKCVKWVRGQQYKQAVLSISVELDLIDNTVLNLQKLSFEIQL